MQVIFTAGASEAVSIQKFPSRLVGSLLVGQGNLTRKAAFRAAKRQHCHPAASLPCTIERDYMTSHNLRTHSDDLLTLLRVNDALYLNSNDFSMHVSVSAKPRIGSQARRVQTLQGPVPVGRTPYPSSEGRTLLTPLVRRLPHSHARPLGRGVLHKSTQLHLAPSPQTKGFSKP